MAKARGCFSVGTLPSGFRLAPSSSTLKALIVFAGGRGGRVGGKPNNNCAPDRLVEATGEFGRVARTPMLWIYIENDTFFGPELSKRMHAAYNHAITSGYRFYSYGDACLLERPDTPPPARGWGVSG